MHETILLQEYTEILLGMRKTFSSSLFDGNAQSNEAKALEVFKYAITIFLKCKDPRAIETILTANVVYKMKLHKVIPFIKFPEELNKKTDFFYIAHLLYPKIVPYDKKDLSIKVYKDILSGKLHKFPKKYLDGFDGKTRANYCLSYMISHYLQFKNTEEMYSYFSKTEGMNAIKKYKLKQACIDIFETPVDFLHDTLSENQKDDFLYMFYKFKVMQARTERKLKMAENALTNNEDDDTEDDSEE